MNETDIPVFGRDDIEWGSSAKLNGNPDSKNYGLDYYRSYFKHRTQREIAKSQEKILVSDGVNTLIFSRTEVDEIYGRFSIRTEKSLIEIYY